MPEKEFAKGVFLKEVHTPYNPIIKVSIDIEEFLKNPQKTEGKIVFDILTGKSGKPYAIQDTYNNYSNGKIV